jgi:hypothetical protein
MIVENPPTVSLSGFVMVNKGLQTSVSLLPKYTLRKKTFKQLIFSAVLLKRNYNINKTSGPTLQKMHCSSLTKLNH